MYELLFWKYLDEVYLNHQEVYESLIENQPVEGLEELPIQVILSRIANAFSNWERVDEFSFKNTKGAGAFHIVTTKQSVQINCYGTKGNDMEKLCQMMEEFKCPLYDPQVPVRYDEFNE
ncbi:MULTISPECIES: hypothetical protein [Flavobacterium]|uniref:Uncharacterized protein n=1 Tax=Flavobacterium hankyongi TaxID=1176532 RepID=A0ABP9A8R5_9FLAO|nr:hypothetical protein [Flavobacterium sp. N1846]